MNRLWLGIGLMAVLLAAGIWVGSFMDRTTAQISGALESAANTALSGDLQGATALSADAQHRWDNAWHRVAAMADHAPMDEIDSLFAQLAIYADTGTPEEFAGYCRRISRLVLAVGEAHCFSWWNLL